MQKPDTRIASADNFALGRQRTKTMKKLFLIWTAVLGLTIASASTVFSQDSTKTTSAKWTLGPSFGFNSYSNIKAHSGFNHQYTYTKTTLSYGIDICYHFSKRSALTTGLHFFNVAYKVDYAWIFQQPNDPAIPRNTEVRANYADIPIIYNFKIISRDKIVIYTATGIVASFLSSSSGSTTYEDNSVRKFDYLNSFISSLHLGIGLQYNLNKNIGIKVEPNYRLFLKGFDSIMEQSPTAICGTVSIVGKIDWKCFFKKGAWRPFPTCD